MRIGAALVGLVAAVSLIAQGIVSARLMMDAGLFAVVWRMLAYFTVLSNLATLILMARAALTGQITAKVAAVITVVMVLVGLGYHTLLAGLWAHSGLAWWADQGLHTAAPILVVLWWMALAPKAGLTGRDALRWLVWPTGYAAYALARGRVTGFYPYPFIDLSALTATRVAINLGALSLAFVAVAGLLIRIARQLSDRPGSSSKARP